MISHFSRGSSLKTRAQIFKEYPHSFSKVSIAVLIFPISCFIIFLTSFFLICSQDIQSGVARKGYQTDKFKMKGFLGASYRSQSKIAVEKSPKGLAAYSPSSTRFGELDSRKYAFQYNFKSQKKSFNAFGPECTS